MDEIIHSVNRIQSIPGVDVDRNIGQGYEAVFTQFRKRFGRMLEKISDIEVHTKTIQEDIATLHTWVAPHRLPNDYVFFLEFYGGLSIERPNHYLFVFGVGPMADDWYSFIMDDDAIYENGFLLISTLAFRDNRLDNYVHFFLDLAGIIHPYGVIGVTSDKPKGEHLLSVLNNPHTHPDHWTKHANSFTEWLEQLVDTIGSFGYV